MGSAALTELASVPWRPQIDAARLRRWGRIWTVWTIGWSIPFIAAGVALVWIEPLAAPVALASLAHAWVIPELHAFRGASVARRKGARHEHSEPVAQGLLGDLLTHEPRELHRRTGLAVERGRLGTSLVGEAGAIGFATVANHAFSGASWRVRRRLPSGMRSALDVACSA